MVDKNLQASLFLPWPYPCLYGDQIIETVVGKTKVINTYGHRKGLLRPGQRHYTHKEKPYIPSLANTAEDFRDARRRGALENIWGSLTGSAKHLIQFQQVEEQLQYEHASKLGLVDIPLDAIVGSVSRPSDFTRKFFPREAVDPGRWQRVKKVMDQAIRPIEVYQIDQAYFVLDGNHRVSVARQRGMTHIPAYVTKIESSVPLTPEDDIEDLIIKNQQVRFRKKPGWRNSGPIWNLPQVSRAATSSFRSRSAPTSSAWNCSNVLPPASKKQPRAGWRKSICLFFKSYPNPACCGTSLTERPLTFISG